MGNRKKPVLRTASSILLLILTAAMTLVIATVLTENEAHIPPDYPKSDISPILAKKDLSDADYETLFFQTGLGTGAIDDLRSRYPDAAERILLFQENFFRKIRFVCERNSIISREESLVDEEGRLINGTQLAPLQNGDIFVTKASHTYGWRQGHCAIVIDAVNGKTLESVVMGTDSMIQDIEKWTNYPNFIVLRLKNAQKALIDAVAQTAVKYLSGIPYRISTGIFFPKDADQKEVVGTYCSHLVWQAYRWHNIDLDFNGGMSVTPKDIANSPELDVIQVYGADPGNVWP